MNEKKALEITNKIFSTIFEQDNQKGLTKIFNLYTSDIKLPIQVKDYNTNEITWTSQINSTKFITNTNMEQKDIKDGWMLKNKEIHSLEDIINLWNEINLTTTERVYDSINVSKSDTIYNCENIYQSEDCNNSKNLIFCSSCGSCEFLLASERSVNCNFGIRIKDSKNCSNSYNVICSNKISNSLFIQDCYDLYECIFCSHISSKKYCIANIQFNKEEYYNIKKSIIEWILTQ